MWSPNTPCSCERVISLARGPWRTHDCCYEHEPQISLRQVLLPTTSLQVTEVKVMKRIRDRVAGLDVHRDTVVACCRVVAPSGEAEVTKQSFATTRKGLGELAVFLTDAGVETVAMEATGVYWKREQPLTKALPIWDEHTFYVATSKTAHDGSPFRSVRGKERHSVARIMPRK